MGWLANLQISGIAKKLRGRTHTDILFDYFIHFKICKVEFGFAFNWANPFLKHSPIFKRYRLFHAAISFSLDAAFFLGCGIAASKKKLIVRTVKPGKLLRKYGNKSLFLFFLGFFFIGAGFPVYSCLAF